MSHILLIILETIDHQLSIPIHCAKKTWPIFPITDDGVANSDIRKTTLLFKVIAGRNHVQKWPILVSNFRYVPIFFSSLKKRWNWVYNWVYKLSVEFRLQFNVNQNLPQFFLPFCSYKKTYLFTKYHFNVNLKQLSSD